MKKLNVLLSAVGLMALSLTSCQRAQYTSFQKPTVQSVEHTAKVKSVQPAAEEKTVAVQTPAQPSLVDAIVAAPATPKAEAPVVAVASTKKMAVMNKKANALMSKVQFKKNEQGQVNLVTREGKKLTGMEKLVVKKVNKQIAKAEKAKAQGKKPFSEWNKYLRIGVILLAASIVLSIIGGAVAWSWGLWTLVSLAWLAGVILTVYGLGLELAWW
ncbi:MAG: hypothetical protein QM669_15390 [Siphonobacter sp.]